jgi:dienelactone hydrolase
VKQIILILSFFIASHLNAQKAFNVLDWKTDVTLNTFLVQKMHQQYDVRRQRFEKALVSRSDAANYSKEIQEKVRSLLGQFPSKSAMHAEVTGTIQCDGYHIEKLVYESFPHHHVTASLYIPQGKGPHPAVLLFCGHEDVSKATESYQKTAILFAKNGFVVLVIDPVSQSERYQFTDPGGKPVTRGGTTEHTLLNESSNLVGGSTPADQLWDNERGLDYLVSRKEVDTSRIGCLGNSGGGMQTIYFAAYDPRIKVYAPCSYVATRERTLELSGPADGCAQMPDEGKEGLEFDDYLMAAAPKPILILAGKYDFIDYTGVLIASEEMKRFYKVLGQPEKIKLFTYDDGHGISQPKREAAVSWFRKWLCNDTTQVHEGLLSTLSDKQLFSTATGQVNTAFPGEINLVERNVALFDSLSDSRKKFFKNDRQTIINKISNLLAIGDVSGDIVPTTIGAVQKEGLTYSKIILRKVGAPPVPLLVLTPSGLIKEVIVLLNDAGKNKLADSTEWIKGYLNHGCAVVLADLRGIGETEDKAELNDVQYFNKEYRNAMLSLHVGMPIVGQRVVDVLIVTKWIEQYLQRGNQSIRIIASGRPAIAALHAAVYDSSIKQVELSDVIQSYKEIFNAPVQKDWYSYIVPGAVKYYDLPDLVQFIGTNKISFAK